jgi:hypothetical protein
MEWLDAIVKVSQVGSAALLAIAVYGAARGWWVPRWIYDEAAKREAAVWTLYEREKATSERLLGDRERRDQGSRDRQERDQRGQERLT